MTFEEFWKHGNYPKSGFISDETHEQDKELASHVWEARQKEIDKLNALLDVVCPERNCPVTYRRVHEGKGVIFAVYGTSSNSYADALEARIKTLEEEVSAWKGGG